MKKLSVLLLVLLSVGAMAQTTWNVDKAHSKIGFSVTHMVVSETEGIFKDYTGAVVSKTDDFNGAEVSFSAKASSIDTENEGRDTHLKSADFFDAEKFPEVTFKGTIVKNGAKYKLVGDFTMKGVTKKVEFDLTYGGQINTGRGTKAGFKINGVVNRQDYGLTWSKTAPGGEMVVSNDVTLVIKVELDKA